MILKKIFQFLKTLPPQVWVVLLAVGVVYLHLQLQQARQETRSIKASMHIIEEDFTRKDLQDSLKIDSLQLLINTNVESYEKLSGELADIRAGKADKNSEHDEEATRIGRIRDVDSLRRVVSDRYAPR